MKKLSLFLSSFFSLTASFAEPILSNEILQQVKEEKVIQNIFLNEEKIELSLVPETELSKSSIAKWNSKQKPRFTTEKLFYLEKSLIGESVNIDKVSKILRSISTMKGTEYYSNRHKKWETLYHEAYLIDSPENKKRIPDDISGSADGKTLYCMQDDNSFGKCYYELSYKQNDTEISVCFDNFESLKFGPITAAKPHNIKINLVVIDEGDYFIVYMICQAYYPNISILENKMIDSFNSRVDSIYNWFVNQCKTNDS